MELDLNIVKLSNTHRDAIIDNQEAILALVERVYQMQAIERGIIAPDTQKNIELWGGMLATNAIKKFIKAMSDKKILDIMSEGIKADKLANPSHEDTE